jgi:acetyl esterase/lipase
MSHFANRRRLLAGALATFVLQGCSATGALNALSSGNSRLRREGVAYGKHPRQQLDVYLPDAMTAGAPLAVFFYGGAWTRGDRAAYRFVGEALAGEGIATIVADYRLSPEVGWRGILQDCAAATLWAFEQAQALGCARDRIQLVGHSAGGYNAAMLALDPRWLAAHGLAPSQLAGWAGLAGPYDFLPISDPDSQVAFDWPRTPPDSQPLAHVSSRAPRTLLLAARHDQTVDPERNTVMLGQRLAAAGVPVRVQLFDRVGHATLVGALAGPLSWLAPVRQELVGFLAAKS